MGTDGDRCEWYQTSSHTAGIFGYYVSTPIYFIFGGLGHVICLLAFYRQRKKDKAYMYQVFVVVSETIEILTYTAYATTFHWFSGIAGFGGARWFTSSYPCMWYAGRVAFPLVNMFITSSLLFSISLAADRAFAMSKPFVYKSINHARHQAVAVFCCYFIGISTSIFDSGRFLVVEKPPQNSTDQEYQLVVNQEFLGSTLGSVAAHLRNALRTLGVVALVVLNVTLLVKYRAQSKKVGDVTTKDKPAEARRRATERVLLLLAVLDSTFNALGMSLLIAYYTKVYITPTFSTCEGPFYTSMVDGFVQLLDIGDFYIAFSVSKQFRDVIASVPCFARLLRLKQAAIRTRTSAVAASSKRDEGRANATTVSVNKNRQT